MVGQLVIILSGEFKRHLARVVNETKMQVTVKLVGESRRRDFFKDDIEIVQEII